jgi:hypothetical protein
VDGEYVVTTQKGKKGTTDTVLPYECPINSKIGAIVLKRLLFEAWVLQNEILRY